MQIDRRFLIAASLFAALSGFACGGPEVDAAVAADDLQSGPKVVSPGIYRSPRPTAADLAALRAKGVKYVLDLENDSAAVAKERPIAQSLGMTFISEPMSGFWAPNDRQVDRILSVLADPTKRPILVHCLHGEDRTGLVIGLHRVFHQGWQPDRAYREMLDNGFHRALFLLNHYYEEKTGWDD